METLLSISKGEYFLENERNKLKLGVDYANQEFAVKIIKQDNKEIVSELRSYLENFANDMIASKSKRNFYKTIYA